MKTIRKLIYLTALALAIFVTSFPLNNIKAHAASSVILYRFSRPDGKDWLMTCNEKEISDLSAAGWNNEGALGWVSTSKTEAGIGVERFYNRISGDRMYSSNKQEIENYKAASAQGWEWEGVAFYSGSTIPVIRYASPTLTHLWSTSKTEQDTLDAHRADGWIKEGVAFCIDTVKSDNTGTASEDTPKPIPTPAKHPADCRCSECGYYKTERVCVVEGYDIPGYNVCQVCHKEFTDECGYAGHNYYYEWPQHQDPIYEDRQIWISTRTDL